MLTYTVDALDTSGRTLLFDVGAPAATEVVWRWGDGEGQTGAATTDVPHQFDGYGQYHVNCRVRLASGPTWHMSVEAETAEAPPEVTSLAPSTAVVGGADLTVTVTGEGFESGSVILWNGVAVATTYVSATSLTTVVSPATASVGTVPVSVKNPGGSVSNAVNFTFTAT